MILIDFRCNRKSYTPAPKLGQDSAKCNSEVGRNISKAKFQTQVTCNYFNCSKKNSPNN